MLIFSFDGYKAFLVALAEEQKITFAEIARMARVEPPYISVVLRKHAHLSIGQAIAIGRALKLNEEELDYFLLLVQKPSKKKKV
mgnify:CR=1 FL=1